MQSLELPWEDFKNSIISKGYGFRELELNNTYHLIAQDGPYCLTCKIDKLAGTDATDYETSHRSKKVDRLNYVEKDGRQMFADNRVPPGYSLYIAGESDNIYTGQFGGGDRLKFEVDHPTRYFQLLNHYYAIGARVCWEGCDMNSFINATLIAPATTGLTNAPGDFNKQALGGGANMIVPALPGAGSWTMNLNAKYANTQILKCTPVPVAGNSGWFDYNADSNTLTNNLSQTGGYNLYDFQINLHAFGRKIWGSKQDGWQTELDVSGLVGKYLFNFWKIKLDFALDVGTLEAQKAAIHFMVAAKRNI